MASDEAIHTRESADRVPDIVIITGMSGSGRTQAMHVFEDMGYFCIDNLPPRLIQQLAELVGINAGVGRHLAVTCDLRSQGLFDELMDVVAALEEHEMSVDLVYLDATDEVLIRRYSENRRRHPLAMVGESTADAIARERRQLAGIRDRADMVIDTSRLSTSTLRTMLRAAFSELTDQQLMTAAEYQGDLLESDLADISHSEFFMKFGWIDKDDADLIEPYQPTNGSRTIVYTRGCKGFWGPFPRLVTLRVHPSAVRPVPSGVEYAGSVT